MVVVWSSAFLLSPPPVMAVCLVLVVVVSLGAFVASRVNEVRYDDELLEVRAFPVKAMLLDRTRLVSQRQTLRPMVGPTREMFHLQRQQPGRGRTVGMSINPYRRRDREELRRVLGGPPGSEESAAPPTVR
jgi:hypothetical protein